METILEIGLEVFNAENDRQLYLEGSAAKDLCDLINRQIEINGEKANLAQYIDMGESITACYPRADFRDNKPAGIVKLTTTRALTKEELQSAAELLNGQFSDGWGESFDSYAFAAGDDEAYVFFTI